MSIKGGSNYTSGYRYYFSVLAGICRGPVDQVFLIKSDGKTFWDGSGRSALNAGDRDIHDPYKPFGYDELAAQAYSGGTITENRTVLISEPDTYGGDKSEGGIDGLLSVYFGAKDQIIAATDYIKFVMSDLLLSNFRGVVTAFFDGEVCANNPYPKAWTYRIRRALKGWDGDVWYPQRAVIMLTDPALATYTRGASDTGIVTFTTNIYNAAGTKLQDGTSSLTGVVTSVTSNYTGATVTTYSSTGGVVVSYAVPKEYNEIYAMNPAHIIYECTTNRDWGRGLDRSLVDNISFTDSANKLWDEGFGLCMKWSRTEDVDVFVQTVLDHIGGVVYTDKLTGLLCLRLVRGGYDISSLSTFDYNSGLVEVTSADTAANDITANEVTVKYRSPVTDTDREARVQNIASQNSSGSFYTISRDYSGIPISTLAIKVAQRDLKIFSGGWKKVELKLDRRGYSINPGDIIRVNAPDRNLDNMIVRVATVSESQVTEGTIDITGAQDIFGLPSTPMVAPQASEFVMENTYPVPITTRNLYEATYRDVYRMPSGGGTAVISEAVFPSSEVDAHVVYLAARPTASSLNFTIEASVTHQSDSHIADYAGVGTSSFCHISHLSGPIGTTDTVLPVTGDILPNRVTLGSALCLQRENNGAAVTTQEFVRLDAISRDAVSGQTYITVARGCIDTPALPYPAGSRVWVYDDTAIVDPSTNYQKNDFVKAKAYNHTSRGDADIAYEDYLAIVARAHCPYTGANFRVNGYPRDATPALTGTLHFTWSHRNRFSQEDALVGEVESSSGYELNSYYDVYIQATRTDGTTITITDLVSGPRTTGGVTTVAINTSNNASIDLTGYPGLASYGKISAFLVTNIPDAAASTGTSLVALSRSYNWPRIDFYYGIPPTAGPGHGFGYDFAHHYNGV